MGESDPIENGRQIMAAQTATFAHWLQRLVGFGPVWIWALVGAFLYVYAIALFFGGFATYLERKISADLQHRIGPNRVGPYGLLQFIADAVKMLAKEDFVPPRGDRFLYNFAPVLVVGGCCSAFAALPFGQNLLGADINIGVFYILAITTLIIPGILLGSWSSANKWSLLGGMRAGAQIVSYEVPVALCVIPAILISGSLQVGTIVEQQGWVWSGPGVSEYHFWNLFHNPFAFFSFFLLFTAGLAETNRLPFDLPEAESELVSGFNTEFSGIRFGLYALAEFIEVFVMCALATTLYLGGWHIPFLNLDHLWISLPTMVIAVIQFSMFLSKVLALVFVVMWLRWTLPRLRVDQLMILCWKGLVPLALVNLVGTAIWMMIFHNHSIAQLLYRLFAGS